MNKKLVEFNNSLKNKKIAIIGAGVSNLPLFGYLYEYTTNITLFDNKEELNKDTKELIKKYNIKTELGKDSLEKLVGFDIIFRSPSCLPTNKYLLKEQERGALITSEIEQVIKLAPCKTIGITGSKGKTTTTTITELILKGMGYNVFVGGNIGKPIFTKLKDIKDTDIILLELSSFQLMNMEVSPNISIVTNISPDHLDIHSSYDEYINAKKNIYLHQNKDDLVVLNYDDEIVNKFSKTAIGKVKYFSKNKKFTNSYILEDNYIKYIDSSSEKIILNTKEINLKGTHNYLNICASLNAIDEYIDKEKVFSIIKDFNGVKHRLELVREVNNVKWYNDSASTTPDKANAGITSFDNKITLIAGGYDKKLDYTPLAEKIIENVDKLILFGENKNKIYDKVKEQLNKEHQDIQIYVLDTLEEVVEAAYQVTLPNGVVLFSPASASFDMFNNAYERGDIFKSLVNKL